MSYNEINARINACVGGILHLGFTNTQTPVAERPRASIYADTCLNWQIMSQTFARLGMTITTAYTTLGEEGLLTSLVEPDVEIVFCGAAQIDLIHKVIDRAERVKCVIYDGIMDESNEVSPLYSSASRPPFKEPTRGGDHALISVCNRLHPPSGTIERRPSSTPLRSHLDRRSKPIHSH